MRRRAAFGGQGNFASLHPDIHIPRPILGSGDIGGHARPPSSSKLAINIIRHLLVFSRSHVGSCTHTVNDQAIINQLACNMTSTFVGLA